MKAPLCRTCHERHWGTEHPDAFVRREWARQFPSGVTAVTPRDAGLVTLPAETVTIRSENTEVGGIMERSGPITERGRGRPASVLSKAERQRQYRERRRNA